MFAIDGGKDFLRLGFFIMFMIVDTESEVRKMSTEKNVDGKMSLRKYPMGNCPTGNLSTRKPSGYRLIELNVFS